MIAFVGALPGPDHCEIASNGAGPARARAVVMRVADGPPRTTHHARCTGFCVQVCAARLAPFLRTPAGSGRQTGGPA